MEETFSARQHTRHQIHTPWARNPASCGGGPSTPPLPDPQPGKEGHCRPRGGGGPRPLTTQEVSAGRKQTRSLRATEGAEGDRKAGPRGCPPARGSCCWGRAAAATGAGWAGGGVGGGGGSPTEALLVGTAEARIGPQVWPGNRGSWEDRQAGEGTATEAAHSHGGPGSAQGHGSQRAKWNFGRPSRPTLVLRPRLPQAGPMLWGCVSSKTEFGRDAHGHAPKRKLAILAVTAGSETLPWC